MRVSLITPGSRGDVQPYVALGKGLLRRGHEVRVHASGDFRGLVTGHGLEFVDLGGSIEAVARGMRDLLEQGRLLKILSSMARTAAELAHRAAAIGLDSCRDSDLIIAGLGGLFVGLALSEKLGIHFLPAFLYPFTPTSEFPGILIPQSRMHLAAWTNRATHRLTQQMMWQTTRAADNGMRMRVLQTGRAPFWGPFAALQQQGHHTLYGYSPHVVPRPADWHDAIHVTGYWFLDHEAGWEPPAKLSNFLQDGPAPFYFGFGSMASADPSETVRLILGALARTGQRGILHAGWSGMVPGDLPKTVHLAGTVPHEWLFPRVAAVVHHGGAGTTAAALRAGVPSIITPFFGDQPFWAQRVHDLGGGPRPIPRRHLTETGLADSIRLVVSDDTMRKRAAALGERIRAEDGVARAVAIIEGVAGTKSLEDALR